MPNNFTIPADTHADGDPLHTTYHNQITDALRAAVGINILDSRFGADPTGSLDSTSALISAISALPSTGGVVKIPGLIPGTSTPATYRMDAGKINNLKSGVHIQGDGYGCATITCDGSGQTGAPYLFNGDPLGYDSTTHLEDVVISGLTVSCTSADMMWGANFVRSHFEYNFLKANSNGYGLWNVSQATGQAGLNNGTTYLAECTFRNTEKIGGSARTTEAYHLDFSGSGLRCNDNRWEKGSGKIWPSLNGDTAQYWMKLTGDAAGSLGSKHNTWDGLIFELSSGVGGLIHLLQCDIVNIFNISSEDLSTTNPVGQPLLLFNTVSGGAEGCQRVTVRDYSRRSGTNVSNTVPDMKFDSHCDQVVIDAPRQSSGGTQLTIDLQGATNVKLRNMPTSYTLLNASGSGLGAPAAAPAGFTPADPTGTASATQVMMGLGSTCTYTPAGTGKVLVTVTGTCQATGATNAAISVGCRRGTGTAPANGAAVTGTRFGAVADQQLRSTNTSTGVGFAFTGLLTLTAGTTYWFDITLAALTATGAQVNNVAMTITEQP